MAAPPSTALGANLAQAETVSGPAVADDETLVAAYSRGDGRAFEALVRRHQERVMAIALRFCDDTDDAKEIAQRAFVQAMDKAQSWRGAGAFRGWLYRIAVNLAKNFRRDRAKLVREEEAPEPTAALDAEGALDRVRARERLRAAIAALPRRQREVVLLRVDADLPFAEIGSVLGITENAAKVSFHHALARLRAHLGEER